MRGGRSRSVTWERVSWPFRTRRTYACFGFDTCAWISGRERVRVLSMQMSRSLSNLSFVHMISLFTLHVYIDGEFLGGELVHVFEEGPRTCSTYALDSGGLKKSRPHHEKTSCFVKVCVCVWYDKARPLSSPMWCPNSSNISPIVRVVSSMDGQPQRSKGRERKESHAHPGCGGSNSWPSQTTMEF